MAFQHDERQSKLISRCRVLIIFASTVNNEVSLVVSEPFDISRTKVTYTIKYQT